MNSELSVHESVKRIEQCINVFFLEDQEKSRTATQYYPWTNSEKKGFKIQSMYISLYSPIHIKVLTQTELHPPLGLDWEVKWFNLTNGLGEGL